MATDAKKMIRLVQERTGYGVPEKMCIRDRYNKMSSTGFTA